MRHRIKNGMLGYECITCNEPGEGKSFTLSGVLVHLGRISVTPKTIGKAKRWSEEHKDIVKKLNYLKEGEEIEIEIEEKPQAEGRSKSPVL